MAWNVRLLRGHNNRPAACLLLALLVIMHDAAGRQVWSKAVNSGGSKCAADDMSAFGCVHIQITHPPTASRHSLSLGELRVHPLHVRLNVECVFM